MSPQGRRVFEQAVASEMRFIREHGYLEFHDDNGRLQRIKVPVMPAVMCVAYECKNIVVGRATCCFMHEQERRRERR